MRTQIIPIGNSRGIRIPRTVLADLRLEGEVELSVEGTALVLRRATRPREGWEEAVTAAGPLPLLDPELATDFDRTDWRW